MNRTLNFRIIAQALFVKLSAVGHLMYFISGLINSGHLECGKEKLWIQQD